jgi:hypothetical protein
MAMHLSYRQAGSLALVRDFYADLVALIRRETPGSWTLVSSTPLPHEGHGPLEVLARSEWRLGPARLVQSVEGGEGNPRDGYGFFMSAELAAPGLDGELRRVSLHAGSWDPFPAALHFTLEGLSADEFVQARAAGCKRFTDDDTANPIWAVDNAEALRELGARDLARALAREALERPGPAAQDQARELLRRGLLAQGDESNTQEPA